MEVFVPRGCHAIRIERSAEHDAIEDTAIRKAMRAVGYFCSKDVLPEFDGDCVEIELAKNADPIEAAAFVLLSVEGPNQADEESAGTDTFEDLRDITFGGQPFVMNELPLAAPPHHD